MSIERHNEARRHNGAKSKGPKTPEGKAVSRLNAMKHGIYSEVTAVAWESEADLVAFGKRMRAQLAPVGELELMLTDRIVSTAWRLRRLIKFEAELVVRPEDLFGRYTGDKMLRLSRYESALDRQLFKTLHELQHIQGDRQGVDMSMPATITVAVTANGDGTGQRSDTAKNLGSFPQNAGAEIKLLAGQ